MNAKYLVFVYMPYDRYNNVMNQPFFADNATMAYNHIMQLRNRRELLYIDILRVSDSLNISKLDNQIPVSRLQGVFEQFEKAGE